MITIGTQEIDRGIEHSSQFWVKRINQISQETSAGSLIVFDNSVSVIEGIINIRLMTKTMADDFRNWLINTIRFQRFSFTITPESYDDVGAGIGVALTECNYAGGTSTESVLKPLGKANKFNLEFPYRAIITPSAGTADQQGNIS